MTDAGVLSSMDVDLLARECRDETRKFLRHEPHVPLYCFELLCRAYRDQIEAALSHAYTIYLPILAKRALRHPQFSWSCQDADAFAHTALANFYHAVKGPLFLQKFQTLAQAIKYMYACVYSAVLEDAQHTPSVDASEDENIPSPDVPSDLDLKELWLHICNLLPDENEQHLAYLRFVLEMKPAEIAHHYPQFWATARAVTVALQTIRRRLRSDEYLRQLFGQNTEPSNDDQDDS